MNLAPLSSLKFWKDPFVPHFSCLCLSLTFRSSPYNFQHCLKCHYQIIVIPKFTSYLDLFSIFSCLLIPTIIPGCYLNLVSVHSPNLMPCFPFWLSHFQVPSPASKPLPDQYLSSYPLPPHYLSFPFNLSSDLTTTPKKWLLTSLSSFTPTLNYFYIHSSPRAPQLLCSFFLCSQPLPHPFGFQ